MAHVQVRLVHGQRLHFRCQLAEDVHDPGRHLRVPREARSHPDDLGAQPQRLPHGHGGMHAKGPRLVGGSGHHAPGRRRPADHHWPVPKLRVVQLLHRGVEGVQVRVKNPAHVSTLPSPLPAPLRCRETAEATAAPPFPAPQPRRGAARRLDRQPRAVTPSVAFRWPP